MDSSGKLTYYELILAVQINEDILNLLFCYKTKKKRLFWGNLINWAVKYSSNDGRVCVGRWWGWGGIWQKTGRTWVLHCKTRVSKNENAFGLREKNKEKLKPLVLGNIALNPYSPFTCSYKQQCKGTDTLRFCSLMSWLFVFSFNCIQVPSRHGT